MNRTEDDRQGKALLVERRLFAIWERLRIIAPEHWREGGDGGGLDMKRYMIYCGGLVVCMAAVCAICVIAFGRTPGQDRDQEFQAAGTDGEGLEPEAEPEGPSGDAKEAEGEEKAGTDAAMSGMTAPEEAQADEEVGSAAPSGAPGPLSIEGTQLVDSAGNPACQTAFFIFFLSRL